jgi:nucleotide-binding universal stress UspA family protein
MYSDILVPVDGSEEVMSAVGHAFDHAERYDSTVHALYVVDESSSGSGLIGAEGGSALEELRQKGERATDTIARRGRERDIEMTTAVRKGLPHRGILEYADENDIELLIMSSHGRSGMNRFLFGSVTERVLRITDRPVLVVSRLDDESEEKSESDEE